MYSNTQMIPFHLGLRNGELNQGFLIQQLNNPQINQRDREVLFAVLSYFNPAAQPSPPENNMPHPVPHPNDVSPKSPSNQCFATLIFIAFFFNKSFLFFH